MRGSSGSTSELTVAVWVGYPDRLQPMETEYRRSPVAGGTYPGRDLGRLHARPGSRSASAREAERGNEDGDDDATDPVEPAVPTTPAPPTEAVCPARRCPLSPPQQAPAPHRARTAGSGPVARAHTGSRSGSAPTPAARSRRGRRRRRRVALGSPAARTAHARGAAGARRTGCRRRRTATAAPRPA